MGDRSRTLALHPCGRYAVNARDFLFSFAKAGNRVRGFPATIRADLAMAIAAPTQWIGFPALERSRVCHGGAESGTGHIPHQPSRCMGSRAPPDQASCTSLRGRVEPLRRQCQKRGREAVHTTKVPAVRP